MDNWEVVNWVKYVDWDIIIGWDLDYETLVVNNWNIIISTNLNTSWKKLWIISLKDWYNIDSDYESSWNIYIKPEVKYIDAIIYSDWAILSTDNSWNVYTSDSTSRTSLLDTQLIFKWSIFSRNTIGWAIKWVTWKYILPWGSETLDFDKAMIYDLNYIRRWNAWCEDTSPADYICDTYSDAFIIIYDPEVQINPPKLFNK